MTIQRLRALRNRLGCDHRAVFATTYLELTNYAALNARLIAAAGLPGYGATRGAYCAAGPSGG